MPTEFIEESHDTQTRKNYAYVYLSTLIEVKNKLILWRNRLESFKKLRIQLY
jgi:hypothetical protein